jgi:hypothetical protein
MAVNYHGICFIKLTPGNLFNELSKLCTISHTNMHEKTEQRERTEAVFLVMSSPSLN